MAAAKRSDVPLGLRVPQEMKDRLEALADETEISQSKLLRKALELLFEQYGKPHTRKKRAS
jgi:predicted DNA-binding protein